MVELAWIDGTPRPLKSVGECVLTRLDGDRIRIEHADPRTLISATLLDQIRRGDLNQNIALDGDVLKIHGVNRTVIYRIGEEVPNMLAYYAEWPD